MSAKPTSWQGRAGKPTRLILLRHGQTPLSIQRRYSGHGNPELTDLGQAQAQAAAHRIADTPAPFGEIDVVYSSPLARTRSTARAVAERLGIDVAVDDRLIETDFGAWEGLTFTEAAQRDPELHRDWLGDINQAAPGGESFAQVAIRMNGFRDALVTAHPGLTVLAVSHVTPIKSLIRAALGVGPELLFRLHLDLASISIAEFYPDGGTVVRLVNDTAHLTGLS